MSERGKGDPPLSPLTPTSRCIVGHTCTKKLFIVYLKFKFNWVSCHYVLNPASRQGLTGCHLHGKPYWGLALFSGPCLLKSHHHWPPGWHGMSTASFTLFTEPHNGRPCPGSSGQPFRAESYFSKLASVFQSIQSLSLPGQSQARVFCVSHVALGATHRGQEDT